MCMYTCSNMSVHMYMQVPMQTYVCLGLGVYLPHMFFMLFTKAGCLAEPRI